MQERDDPIDSEEVIIGYTHYYYQQRALTETEWKSFTEGFQRLLALPTCPPLARTDEDFEVPPEITEDLVCFNGVGDDGHETCVIYREKTDWITGEPSKKDEEFSFCKTARKPYDDAVTAVLAYLDTAVPDAFRVSSDGYADEWRNGVILAQEAWPDIAIDVPRSLRDGYDEDADLAV